MARFPEDTKRDAAAKLLAEAGHSWARVTLRTASGAFPAGSKFYGIPSTKNDGAAYYTNLKMCTCPDYQRRAVVACKHMRAVDIYAAQVRSQRKQTEGSASSADPTPISDQQRDEMLLARLIAEQTAHATRLRLTGWEACEFIENDVYAQREHHIARLQSRLARVAVGV